jgi:hypothetical protein
MGVHYDDMPDHDGYTRRTAAGLLSVCSCGWTGTVHHDSPAGRHNARQEWDDEHRPAASRDHDPARDHREDQRAESRTCCSLK